MKIRRASSRDSGNYACVARNLSGDVETSCKVIVESTATAAAVEPAPARKQAAPVVAPKAASPVKPKHQAPVVVVELKDVELDDGQDLK